MKTNWIPYHLKQNEKLWPIIQDMLEKEIIVYKSRKNVEIRMTEDWALNIEAKNFDRVIEYLINKSEENKSEDDPQPQHD